MIADAIQKIVNLGKGQLMEIDGCNWYFYGENFRPCLPPSVTPIESETLASVVDYVNQNPDGNSFPVFIHVESFRKVSVCGQIDPKFKMRPVYLTAMTPFNETSRIWLPIDQFIIHLQANFVSSEKRNELLSFVSGIRCDDNAIFEDNGVSQQVAVKRGIKSALEPSTPNPITLTPFRTFPEIKQPESPFVFRLRQLEGDTPTACLFCGDGGTWRIEAATAIREWLSERVNCPILA